MSERRIIIYYTAKRQKVKDFLKRRASMSLTSNRIKPQKNGRFLLLTFLIALGSAAIVFVPFIIYNGGVFYYYGDFNVQEIPFYQMIHSQVRDGDIGWNHLTDLGTDTLASYSFYLMGSPFFWMTIPVRYSFRLGAAPAPLRGR